MRTTAHPFPEIERAVSEAWQRAEEERLRQQLPYAGLLMARSCRVRGRDIEADLERFSMAERRLLNAMKRDGATAQHSWSLQLLALEALS